MKKNANLAEKGQNLGKAEGKKIQKQISTFLDGEQCKWNKNQKIQSLVPKEGKIKVEDWAKDELGYGKFVTEKGTSNRKIVRNPKGETVIGIKTGKQIKTKNPAEKQTEASIQEEQKSELFSFLKDLGQEKYFPLLKQKRCKDVTDLSKVLEAQFKEIGITLGHKLKIPKRARELHPYLSPQLLLSLQYWKASRKKKSLEQLLLNLFASKKTRQQLKPHYLKQATYKSKLQQTAKRSHLSTVGTAINTSTVFLAILMQNPTGNTVRRVVLRTILNLIRQNVPCAKKKFLKMEGQIERGIWLCSETCMNLMIKSQQDLVEDQEIDIDKLLSL